MAIVKMKKLKLLVSRTDREDILRELMLLGCVEVSEPDELMSDPEVSALVERENAELDRHKAQLASLAQALEIIKEYAPGKTAMFAAKPVVTGDRLLDENETGACLDLAKTLETLSGRIARLYADENNEKSLIESLTPWSQYMLPLDSEGTGTSAIILGSLASGADIDALQEELHAAVGESQAFLVSTNKELHYLCVICLRDKQNAVNEVLRRFNFSSSSLKNLSGTAAENIAGAEQRLTELANEKEELTKQITDLTAHKLSLQLCYDHVATKIARDEAADKLLGTQYSLMLTGWVPAQSEPELGAMLSKYAAAWEVEDPDPEEYPKVPVELKNNSLTGPLSMVTEMYSLPKYGTVDPNGLMMPFFVLFYGLMMADMGYGAIMIIASIFVKRKKLQGGTMKQMFDLMFLCGISTFVIGLLTGGLFGDAPTQLVKLFGGADRTFALPFLFNPLENTMEVLIGALALGFLHIVFGMGIKLYMQAKDGHLLDGILDICPWWLLFIGIGVGALGVTWWVAIAGLIAIILTQGRAKPTIVGKLIGGLAGLYDITGYFGDILSYSRVMALMLAGGVIAMVFNTLGALTGNIVTFLIIFAIGHALNFGLNILGCYVHDLRLQCLEFFGKFYEDGGKPFSPLKVKIKYNNLVNK